ncbi:MAG: ATP-binding protein [Methanomassiliicoccaceae archaeon]|nr:ATP-binding protein [Methanomassiliicoccaceae archaeon]
MNDQKIRLVRRERYLSRIRPHIGKPYIKILTGIRRGGKSCILRLLAAEIQLKDPNSNIVFIDFESYSNVKIAHADDLYRYVSDSVKEGVNNVLMIDEIQEVDGWEKVVASFNGEGIFDIYVTGSNSGLLSSEYSSHISGRYVSFDILTLSFTECLEFRRAIGGDASEDVVFDTMLRHGGFPVTWISGHSDNDSYSVIRDIYESIVLRDIVKKHKLRNDTVLKRIVMFLCENIASPTSLNNMYTELVKEHGRIRKETVYKFSEYLEEAFVFRKSEEEGLKGKEILTPKYKFYLSDIGIKNALLGYRSNDIQDHLENIVFLEMKSRGYDVTIGNINGKEVDLVCRKDGSRIYVQVVYRLSSDKTIEREFGNLRQINDGYPKYVVTMDPDWVSGDVDGIRYMHVREFLKIDL